MEYQTIQPRYGELKDRVALVTGAGRGIGRGIAFRLAREQMRVVINDRDADAAYDTTEQLKRSGAQALAVVADLSQAPAIDQLINQALSEYATIDVLVNNAAILAREELQAVKQQLWDLEFAVNVKAPFLLSQRAAAAMRQKGRGVIIHISSVSGLRAHFQGLPYNATKGAIDAMTRAMGIELAEQGIRVNGVAPGAIHTERRRPLDDPRTKAMAELVPARRMGLPEDIAATVAFLASDESSYIIGQTLYVDGGITAQLSPSQHPI
jgi:3-oxoacyl-[acyl-carrier protein] reductase